jgi:hypothetical protein
MVGTFRKVEKVEQPVKVAFHAEKFLLIFSLASKILLWPIGGDDEPTDFSSLAVVHTLKSLSSGAWRLLSRWQFSLGAYVFHIRTVRRY